MLTVQDIFNDLAYSELSHTIIGNSPVTGQLSEKYYPQIISALNLALKDIYTKLNLATDSVILHQQPNLTKYIIDNDYCSTTGIYTSDFYLEYGNLENFPNNLNKILTIKTSEGINVKINDDTDGALIKIITPNTLLINNSDIDVYTIEYSAFPELVVLTDTFDPKTYYLNIPEFIEEPILTFITHKLTKRSVKLEKGEISPRYTLIQTYYSQIKAIQNAGLTISDDNTNTQFNDNGWI